MKIPTSLIFILSLLQAVVLPAQRTSANPADELIHIWYGPVQHFGQMGRPQRWINVLGNISRPGGVDSVTFSLNEQAERKLSLGSDLHRLALPGDFNVELAWEEVPPGEHDLRITAYQKATAPVSRTIRLVKHIPPTWPLPYVIDFSRVDRLPAVVQVVDGHWELGKDGVRTVQRYYDRVLTLGDTTWKDYEATIQLTVHDFTPSEPGPPTYGVTHFGVALRWRGHHADGRQPSRKWFPLGAQGEFLLKEKSDSCRWRILFDGSPAKPPRYAEGHNRSVLGQAMRIKAQVCTLSDGRSRYRFKQWMEDQTEPAGWDVEGFESGDYTSGALCLVPHNSDVTIHRVEVRPLPLSNRE